VNVCPLFVAQPQSEGLIQPTEGTFDHPAPSPQSAANIRCCASRAKAQSGGHADLAGLTQHHNHGRLVRSQDDGVTMGRVMNMS
jgi:hypothetical protein